MDDQNNTTAERDSAKDYKRVQDLAWMIAGGYDDEEQAAGLFELLSIIEFSRNEVVRMSMIGGAKSAAFSRTQACYEAERVYSKQYNPKSEEPDQEESEDSGHAN